MRKTGNSTYVSYKKVGWYVVIRKISRFMVCLVKILNAIYVFMDESIGFSMQHTKWCGKFEDVNNHKV